MDRILNDYLKDTNFYQFKNGLDYIVGVPFVNNGKQFIPVHKIIKTYECGTYMEGVFKKKEKKSCDFFVKYIENYKFFNNYDKAVDFCEKEKDLSDKYVIADEKNFYIVNEFGKHQKMYF